MFSDGHTFGKNVCLVSFPFRNDLCGNRNRAAFFVRSFGCALLLSEHGAAERKDIAYAERGARDEEIWQGAGL